MREMDTPILSQLSFRCGVRRMASVWGKSPRSPALNLELARSFGATEVIQVGTPEGDARMAELRTTPFDLGVEAAGVTESLQQTGPFARVGGRTGILAWHYAPRSVDCGPWHMRGLNVLNAGPMISTDHNVDIMQRAVWLMELGVFGLSEPVTHSH